MHEKLLDDYGEFNYIPHQWFQYQFVGQGYKFCQTDGLLFSYKERKVLVIEIKYKHTIDAYWQLENKYVPVMKHLFKDWEITTCEIVKWFDPSTPFPVLAILKKDILTIGPSEFGVHILTP